MSWFDTKTLSNYAKTALKQAQKNIDKVLDIKDEVVTDSPVSIPTPSTSTPYNQSKKQSHTASSTSNLSTDTFFDSFFESSQAGSKKKDKLTISNNKFEKSNESERSKKKSPSNEWDDFSNKDTHEDTHEDTQIYHIIKQTSSLDDSTTEAIKPVHPKEKKELISVSLKENNKLIGKECLLDHHNRDDYNIDDYDKDDHNRDVHNIDFLNIEITTSQFKDAEKNDPINMQNINSIQSNPSIQSNQSIQSYEKSENFINENLALTTETFSDSVLLLEPSLTSSVGSTVAGHEEDCIHLETDLKIIEILCSNNNENNISDTCVYDENDSQTLDKKTEISFSNISNDIEKNIDNKLLNEDVCLHKNKILFEENFLDIHHDLHNNSSPQIDEYTEEIKRLKCIVEARENKMVELSHENIRLSESNSTYKIQLEQCETLLKQKNKTDEESFNQLKKTLNETESKFQLLIKERDILKQKLAAAEQQIQKSEKDLHLSLTQSVADKEETIKALLEEGEALSKKELESNIKIKKLRVKLKEFITKNDKFSITVNELNKEIQKVNDMLLEKEKENQLQEAEIIKLQKMTDLQEDEITALKESIDENDEKYKAMETSIQVAYSEINRLSLEKAQKESEVNEGFAAIAMKKELELKIKELERLSLFDREELLRQMDDLQMAYSRLEQQSVRQENYLKREIQDLLKRLEDGENRNQELLQSVSTATKPLLRQIENLQTSHSKHVENWERVEFNLTSRLSDNQHQLALGIEKERSATELADELKAKCKALEVEFRRVKQEKSICDEILEEEQSKRKNMEEFYKRDKLQNDDVISKLKKMYDGILNEKSLLEDQLATERLHHEHEISQLVFNRSSVQSGSLSRQISTDSLVKLDETGVSQKNFSMQLNPDTLPNSIQEWSSGMRSTTTTASLEHIDIQLRKRDGELFLLREEVNSLERTRASLARDLVSATSRLEELEVQSQELQTFKFKYEELGNRYNAMLQMYGEKEEENEELKMDLQDIKALYKQQVQELLLSGR